ncbi:DNA-3-methyladenine glycosylase I [Pediococcus acidilactici]
MENNFICTWARDTSPLMQAYHANEWGQVSHDDRYMFEMLSLEGYQAGLSWNTILNKRAAFKEAFANFEVNKGAQMTDADVEKLMQNPAILRHRGKLKATITNAQAFIRVQTEFGSFDKYIWQFVNGRQINDHIRIPEEIHAQTPLSAKISTDLKQRGFKFVGPVIVYSFMQAIGLINDHEIECMYNPG